MALDNSDNSNIMTLAGGHDLSDFTSMTGDLLHPPNTHHGHFFNQGSSLLSDSSPLNSLSSPLELRISRVSANQLLSSGNSAFLQSQLVIERQQRKIGELENKIRELEKDIVEWKTRSNTAEATVSQLILNIPKPVLDTKGLPVAKDIPPPLDRKNFPNIRFWTSKAYDTYSRARPRPGETNGMETNQRRPGRPRKDEDNGNCYPYLENADGTPVPWELIVKIGQKARRVWHTLLDVNMAPASWGKASEPAYTYFNTEMLNVPELKYFRYCDGNWKLTLWASKAYSSWATNYIKPKDRIKTERINKRKHDIFNDDSLFQINGEQNEGDDIAHPPDVPDPIQDTSTSEAAHTQPTMVFVDPLEELYNSVSANNEDNAREDNSNTTAVAASPQPPMATVDNPTPSSAPLATAYNTEPIAASPQPPAATADNPAASSSIPLASVDNTKATDEAQPPAKRTKGSAVVGTGLTEKNFCMKDWLQVNPNGSKEAFEKYFKALSADAKKIYKNQATEAKAARKAKNTGLGAKQSATTQLSQVVQDV